MRVFGLDIQRARPIEKTLSQVFPDRGWIRIFESFTGAWQRNVEINFDSVMANHAVWACTTLIASDISKLRIKLVARDDDGIWSETSNPAFTPVLRKPNDFQTRVQFWESWVLSKLMRGNTYVLKGRDNRGVVNQLWVLDPTRTRVLVSDTGDIFYELNTDPLAGLPAQTTVPASEIIHDRFNCLFHPLIGMSPIFASGLAAAQALRIQDSSTLFFQNKSMPGGILTAPGAIANDTAQRLKTHWDNEYSGANAGKIAVLGDGLKFEPITLTAEESQLIEQLKWTAEVICSTFHVPPYKIGIGPMPAYNNIQALNVEYYSQCLQVLIEAAELCMDEGIFTPDILAMAGTLGTEFDLDGLLRMDSVTQMQVLRDGVGAAVVAPNEARKKIDLKPVAGGDAPLSQQQNFSLEALAKRDAQADPFAPAKPPTPPPAPIADVPPAPDAATAKAIQQAALSQSLGLWGTA